MSDSWRTPLAIAFCLLLVSSMVTPAVARAGPTMEPDRGIDRQPTPAPQSPGITLGRPGLGVQLPPPANASSLRLRRGAFELLNATTFPGKGDRKERLKTTLNGTFEGYVAPNRTVEEPFEADQRVAAQTLAHNRDVARWLVASDAALARTAIADARAAREELLARNVSFDRAAVDRDIRAAARAYGQGERVRSNSPVGAIPHYRQAWDRAQQALDRLDRAFTPNVTLVRQVDPPHNDTLDYTLVGRVVDVRTYEIDNVTVRINGQRNLTVPVRGANTSPGAVGTFVTRLSLDEQVNRITVTAEDPIVDLGEPGADPDEAPGDAETDRAGNSGGRGAPGDDDREGDRGPPDDGDGDDGGESDEGGEDDRSDNVGRAVLRLDGDGLVDRYELRVTETDPLDPDSDSARTAANESDNGVLDGFEDFDNDSVATTREQRAGTDPFAADTDGDRLRDFTEIFYRQLNATNPDTDGDGVRDDRADPDGDGLTTYAEVQNGTSPFEADTDLDGLNDSREVQELPTDPTQPDTDQDGLDDAAELELGTDPTVPDSDGDGVLDGNETFTTTAVNDSLGTQVSITGEGDVAEAVRIANGSHPGVTGGAVTAARVSPIVNIEADRAFEAANVTIGYNESALPGSESELLVFTFDPDLGTYVPLNTSVDRANDTVTTRVEHFSRFVVFSYPEWEAQFPDDLRANLSGTELFNRTRGWEGDGRIENGSLVVESNGSISGDVIVVAKDGSGDFEQIQPAVNAAGDNATIFVRNGTYHEEIVVNSSVRLVGPNATLSGVGLGEDTSGVTIVNGTTPTIAGLTISKFAQGIDARNSTSDLHVVDVSIVELHGSAGIDAYRASGNWTLDMVRIANGTHGIFARQTTGSWQLKNVSLTARPRGFAINLWSAQSDWNISDATIEGRTDGLLVLDASGEIQIRNTKIGVAFEGIFVKRSSTEFVLNNVEFSTSGGSAITAALGASGDWKLTNVQIANSSRWGISSFGSTGDWDIRNALISGTENGIRTDITSGSWNLTNVNISNNDGAGILMYRYSGNITFNKTKISNNADEGAYLYGLNGNLEFDNTEVTNNSGGSNSYYDHGVEIRYLRGNVSFHNTRLADNGGRGIYASYGRPSANGNVLIDNTSITTNGGEGIRIRSSKLNDKSPIVVGSAISVSANGESGVVIKNYDGSVGINNSLLENNGKDGVIVSDGTGDVEIHQSKLDGNGGFAVNNRGASQPVDATTNWWGQATGPVSDQVANNVTTDPYCTDPDCAPTRDEVGADENVGANLNLSFETGPNLNDSLDYGDLPSGNTTKGSTGNATVSRATRNVSIPETALNATLQARLNTTVGSGNASVRVVGENATLTAFSTTNSTATTTVTANLTRFAGQTVTLELVTQGDATLRARSIAVGIVRDSDGDGLPDSGERSGLPVGHYSSLTTDPFDNDTDNDGLSDGTEVGDPYTVNRTVRGGNGSSVTVTYEFYTKRSDPREVDTDDDGLSDYEEYQTWTINYTTTPDQSEQFLAARKNGTDALAVATPRNVSSDPQVPDTDSDGLGDARERVVGTDPNASDTDGDGIRDDAELTAGEDPVLYDHTAPTLAVAALSSREVNYRADPDDPLDVRYKIQFIVEDPSGVAVVTLRKNQQAKTVVGPGATDTDRRVNATLTAGRYSDPAAETLLGPKLRIVTEDTHGNTLNVTRRGGSAFTTAAQIISDNGLDGLDQITAPLPFATGPIGGMAALAGMTYYTGTSIQNLADLVKGPLSEEFKNATEAYLKIARLAGKALDRPQILAQVAKKAGWQLFVVMDRRNPFPQPDFVKAPLEPPENASAQIGQVFSGGTSNYISYAKGFYAGAVGALLAQELLVATVTAGTANLGKWAIRGTSAARKFSRVLDNARTFTRAATVGRLSEGTLEQLNRLRKLGYAIGELAAPLRQVGAGQRQLVVRTLRRVEDASGLPVADQRALTGIVARTDADGDTAETLDDIAEEDRLDDLTAIARCASGGRARVRPHGVASIAAAASCPADLADVETETARRAASDLVDARADGEITVGEFERVADALVEGPADSGVLVRAIARGDEDAMQFVGNADQDTLSTFTDLSKRNGGSVSQRKLEEYAQRSGKGGDELVAQLDDVDGGRAFFREADVDLLAAVSKQDVEPQVASLVDSGVSTGDIRRIRNGLKTPDGRPAGDFDELNEIPVRTVSRLESYSRRNTPDAENPAITDQADAAEFVVEGRLLTRLGYSEENFKIYTEVLFKDQSGNNFEIDHVVVRREDSRVVALGETKSDSGKSSEAIGQIKEDLSDLDQAGVEIIEVERAPGGTDDLEISQFPDNPAQNIDNLFIFGPGKKFSRSTQVTVGTVTRTVQGDQIMSTKALRLLGRLSEEFITGQSKSVEPAATVDPTGDAFSTPSGSSDCNDCFSQPDTANVYQSRTPYVLEG